MAELDKGLSQIVLYTKHHFHRMNLINDLKILIGKRCGYDPEYVTYDSIIYHLLEIIETCEPTQPKGSRSYLRTILEELFRWKDKIEPIDLIEKLVGQISTLYVLDKDNNVILDLGEPDYDWLPAKVMN